MPELEAAQFQPAIFDIEEKVEQFNHDSFLRGHAGKAMVALAAGLTLVGAARASAQSFNNLYTPLTPAELVANGVSTEGNSIEMQAAAVKMITSIPGQSIDLKQKALNVLDADNGITAVLNCPTTTHFPYPPIKSVTVHDNHKASLVFCKSEDRISIFDVNLSNPKYKKAFSEFQNDPLRNEEWGGDQYKYDLFTQCPDEPFKDNPNLSFTYNNHHGVRVSFKSLSTEAYCDQMGQYTTSAEAQIRSHGKFKRIGNRIVHIDGLREVLAYGSSVLFSGESTTSTGYIKSTGKLCHGNNASEIRVKLTEHFKGMKSQTFAHALNGTSTGVRSVSRSRVSAPKEIC